MARALRWKELSIGITVAAAVLVAALGILIFGRVGILHGKKFTLYVTTDAARGVIRGTEVWLEGQKVGLVEGVTFQPPTTSPSERLVLTLSVLDNARTHLRGDTRVQIRSGTSIIGDQVVYLSGGTARSRVIASGDTIHAGNQTDIEQLTSDAALASRELPAIMSNVKLLAAQLQTTEATLGALGVDKGGPEMRSLRARAQRLIARLKSPDGSMGLALDNRDLFRARAASVMAQVDSVRALVASNEHSLGRFRRDSTLKQQMVSIRSELAEVQRLAASPDGTIGRLRTDSAIVHGVHRDMMLLDSLFADMKKHPFRYLAF
jgi:phospholipid/cholesterol/gamma-HCH transport system substrate-binding protein